MLEKRMGSKPSGLFVAMNYEIKSENPTLLFAQNCGMQLEFVSRRIPFKK
jgi:hypothetical protein